jgi:predicted enzyme related to lactoylglutathione lyase
MRKLISWVEIPATDFGRAVKFYNAILGLNMKETDCGTEKMACFPTGEGAVSFAPGFNPSKDGVLLSLNADNELEKVMERIERNGGRILQSKTKIEAENRGYFALFVDSEGNRMGLYGN